MSDEEIKQAITTDGKIDLHKLSEFLHERLNKHTGEILANWNKNLVMEQVRKEFNNLDK